MLALVERERAEPVYLVKNFVRLSEILNTTSVDLLLVVTHDIYLSVEYLSSMGMSIAFGVRCLERFGDFIFSFSRQLLLLNHFKQILHVLIVRTVISDHQ